MADTINPNSFFNQSENNEASRALSMAQESFNMAGSVQEQLGGVIKSVEVLKQEFVDNSSLVNNTFETVDDTIKTAFSQLQVSFSKLSETVTILSDDVNALSDVFFRMKSKDAANLEAQADQAFEAEDKAQKANKQSGAGGGSGAGGAGGGDDGGEDDKDDDKKGGMNPLALGAMGLLGLGGVAFGGIKRGLTGAADFLTGGLFDFDGKNAAQGGGLLRRGFTGAKKGIGDLAEGAKKGISNLAGDVKERGIGGTLGGIADHMTLGLTDFDGKGKGGFNLFGKKKEEGEVSSLESRVAALESGNVKGDGKGDGKTVTRREVKPHHFDMETGKAYIDGEEVPIELYNEFKSMSPDQQLSDPRFSTGDPIISPKDGTDEKGLKPTFEKGEKKEKGLFGGFFGGLFGGKKKEEKSKVQQLTDAGYNITDHGNVGGERIIEHTGPEHGRNVGGFLGIGGKGKLATKTKSQRGIISRSGSGMNDSLDNIMKDSNLEVPKRSFGNRLLGGIDALTGNLTDFDMKGGAVLGGGLIDAATGNFTDLDRRGGETFGVTRGVTGVADALTGNALDLDKKGEFGEGTKRAAGGFADFATGGMFDFDKKNRKGAPKDFGIRRIAGGIADSMTMGLTDFDKRGKGNLQFDPISGGKDKAWGSADEQAKRREKQSGMGIKRGIGGALDYATLGTFDFDKQNKEGAPKGLNLGRIAGGIADWATMGLTDFDKRGKGNFQFDALDFGGKGKDKKKKGDVKTGTDENYQYYPLEQPRASSLAEVREYMKNNPDAKGGEWVQVGEHWVLETKEQTNQRKEKLKKGAESGDKYAQSVLDFDSPVQPVKSDASVAQQIIESPESDTTEILEAINAAGANTTSSQGGQVDKRPPKQSDVPATPVKGTACFIDCINMSKNNSQFELQF